VTGAERSESEDASVGGLDNVDASVFDDFDYVALGHIHRAQKIERNTVRYCGTPLKYSFSEINHKKSVTIIEITKNTDIKDEIKIISQPAKNSNYNISLRELELKPLRDMREIKGSLENLIARTTWAGEKTDDYIRVILTDETEQFNAIQKLRAVYPNVMALAYDNKKTRESSGTNAASKLNGKNEIEIFEEFYKQQNGSAMSEEQKKYVESLIKEIFEE
jgi:exonuclease SbcD